MSILAEFQPKDKILILKFLRLSHVPTGVYSAELMVESGLPILLCEFGNIIESQKKISGKIPSWRISCELADWFPRAVRFPFILLHAYFQIVWACLRYGKPCCLIAHGIFEQVLAYLVNLSLGIPYLVHVHEVYEKEKNRGWLRVAIQFEGTALRGADFTLFSEETRLEIYRKKHQLVSPSYLVFNCPRLRKKGTGLPLRQQWQLPPSSKLLLYIGGIDDKNALQEAIEALPMVPDLIFILIGWGSPQYLESLQTRARVLGVEARVKFVGKVPDRWDYLDAVDFAYCVYRVDELRTQHIATASNKLMEALAAGVPVVVSSSPDFKSFLAQYEVGVGLETISAEMIAKALQSMIDSPTECQKKSNRGLSAHRQELHYERQFRQVLEQIRVQFCPAGVGARELKPAG